MHISYHASTKCCACQIGEPIWPKVLMPSQMAADCGTQHLCMSVTKHSQNAVKADEPLIQQSRHATSFQQDSALLKL